MTRPKTPGIRFDKSLDDLLVDFEAVQPHPQNPNNGDADAVRASIETNGVYRPIIAQQSRRGAPGYILAGHTQYDVEVTMQLEAGADRPLVPVVFIDVDDKTAKRIVLADNRTAELARLDDALLLDLLRDLDGDLLGTGYTDDDLDKLAAALDTSFEPVDDETRLDEVDAKPCPKCGYDLANDPEALRDR